MRDCCGYAFICRSGYFAFPFVIHIENAPTQQTIKHATGILLRVRVRAFVTFEYQNWRLVAPTQTGGGGISKLGVSFFHRCGDGACTKHPVDGGLFACANGTYILRAIVDRATGRSLTL